MSSDVVPERVFLSMGGGQLLMVPAAREGLYLPFASDSYMELERDDESWTLRTNDGTEYAFAPVTDLGISDPDLWVLTEIRDRATSDRVVVRYEAAAKELDIAGFSYAFDGPGDEAKPLYNVKLEYESAEGVISRTDTWGVILERSKVLSKVVVNARNNLDASSESHDIRTYHLEYTPDRDTEVPRLVGISISGEKGATTQLPLATYAYGSATKPFGEVSLIRYSGEYTIPMAPGQLIEDAPYIITLGVSVTDHQHHGDWDDDWDEEYRETTVRTRFAFRDLTGDNVPDLVYHRAGSWHVVAGRVTDSGPTFDTGIETQWTEPSEIYVQRTFSPRSGSPPMWMRQHMSVTETLTEFVDWNADGRIDIVDVRGGSDIKHWQVWLNSAGQDGLPVWTAVNVDVSDLHEHVVAHNLGLDLYNSGYLAIRRARSWGFVERLNGPAGPQAEIGKVETVGEWTLLDANGDAFPDHVANTNRVRNCIDAQPHPCTQVTPKLGNSSSECYREYPSVNECREDLQPPPPNEHVVLIRRQGMLLSEEDREYPLPLPNGIHDAVDFWQTGEGTMSPPIDEATVPPIEYDYRTSVGGPSWGDWYGIGRPLADGGHDAWFESDREEACEAGLTVYHVRQTRGRVDLNGDGFLDIVARGVNNVWQVRFGSSGGYSEPREINVVGTIPFELSNTITPCSGNWSVTAGGLEDLDGDGRPELIRVHEGVLKVASLEASMTDAQPLGIGRLIEIGNGYGATTKIRYANNKTETSSLHSVPTPEVVVAETQLFVDDGSSPPGVPARYAYAQPDRIYDTSLNRIVFLGYRRTLRLLGERKPRDAADQVHGFAVLEERVPPQGHTHAELVLAGRPKQSFRFEGLLPADPRALLLNAPASKWRAGSTVEYGVVELTVAPGAPTGVHECVYIDEHGTVPSYLEMVCNRSAIIYEKSRSEWEGTEAPAAGDANVIAETFVEKVDGLGRPLLVHDYGDVRTVADDRCMTIAYAEPSQPDAAHISVTAGVWTTDCGWLNPILTGPAPAPGNPVVLAGMRFAYDGLQEGYVRDGRLTQRIVEVYDTANGASIGEHVDAHISYDPLGNIEKVVAAREIGTEAQRITTFKYDAFGVTLDSTSEAASDLAVSSFVRDVDYSVWPSVEQTEKGLNGEVFTTIRDEFGRVKATIATAGTTSHTVASVEYDDTPAHRVVTTTAFPSDSTRPLLTRTHLDALGRVRFQQDELGTDYSGATLVSGVTAYDAWGRAQYRVLPIEWSSAEFSVADLSDDVASWPRGVTSFYDDGGRLIGTIEGDGLQPESWTSTSNAIYASTVTHSWENGRYVTRSRGPSENDPSSQYYLAWRESRSTALGWEMESARYTANGTRIDLVTRQFDHFGNEARVRRFNDPSAAAQPVDWNRRFDSNGRMISVVEPGTAETKFLYDEWGAMVRSEWVDGQASHQVRYRYDGLGRATATDVVLVSFGVDNVESAERFYYDTHSGSRSQPIGPLLGRLSKVETLGVGANYYGYDAFGKVTSETYTLAAYGSDIKVSTDYEPGGLARVLRINTPAGTDVIEYQRDSALRVRRVKNGIITLFNATEVDTKGRYRSVKLGNGVTETFAYAPYGREELQRWTVKTTTGVFDDLFTGRDADGRLTNEQINELGNSAAKTYTYDALGRLDRAVTMGTTFGGVVDERFTYDPLGNVLTKRDPYASTKNRDFRYSTSIRDQLCRADLVGQNGSACHFTYDAAGNVLTDTSTISGGTRSFQYDSANRIRSVKKSNWDAAFTYGPGGRLATTEIRKSGSLDRRVWSFGDLVEVRRRPDGATDIERRVPGPLGIIATLRSQGTQHDQVYVHGDGRSNRVFTRSSGGVVQNVAYRTFGQVNYDSGSSSALTYTDDLWNGGDDLRELGVVVLGARIYDPAIGRFLQPDPIAFSGSSTSGNPYSFSFNDPVNYADPTGLFGDCIGKECRGGSADGIGGLLGLGVALGMAAYDHIVSGSHNEVITNPASMVMHVMDGAQDLTRNWTCKTMCNWAGSIGRGGLRFVKSTVKGVGQGLKGLANCVVPTDPAACMNFAGGTVKGAFDLAVTVGEGVTDPEGAWDKICAAGDGDCIDGLVYTGSTAAGMVAGGLAARTRGAATQLGVNGATVQTGARLAAAETAVVEGTVVEQAVRQVARAPDHHVMTNKNWKSKARGGPWSPRFVDMARRAGMTLDDALNRIRVPGHRGPHPEAYHQAVYDRLQSATRGLKGDDYAWAFRQELANIRIEVSMPGSALNRLVTRQ